MREDEYLSHAKPLALLEQTGRWATLCSSCQRQVLGGQKCYLCGGQKRCRPPSERKLRLVACACVRFTRDEVGADLSDAVLAAAERWGEGDVWPLPPPHESAHSPIASIFRQAGREGATRAIHYALRLSRSHVPQRLASSMEQRMTAALEQAGRAAKCGAVTFDRARQSIIRQFRLRDQKEAERLLEECRRRLCDAIRDVLGNPYRPLTVKPAWLDANGGLARTIARGIDAEGRFDEVPVLADALEDAGCDDERLLAHARQPGHYRGCWLIDAILGKG